MEETLKLEAIYQELVGHHLGRVQEQWFRQARERAAAGRDAEEIDNRYPVFERFSKPPVIGCTRVSLHEGVVDGFDALENLAMHLALIVVPDLASRLRKHGLD